MGEDVCVCILLLVKKMSWQIVNDVILSSEGEEFRKGIYKMHFYLKNSPF